MFTMPCLGTEMFDGAIGGWADEGKKHKPKQTNTQLVVSILGYRNQMVRKYQLPLVLCKV